MVKIILASQSAIRKKMLEEAGLPFEVVVSNVDETFDSEKSSDEQIKEVALRKAMKVLELTKNMGKRVIFAADQNIFFENEMYGKPENIEEAEMLIRDMAGSNAIYAYVGNALIYADGENVLKVINEFDASQLYMEDATQEEIEKYLETGDPLSKCGGINVGTTPFLHLVEGRMSTARGMTLEILKEFLATL